MGTVNMKRKSLLFYKLRLSSPQLFLSVAREKHTVLPVGTEQWRIDMYLREQAG